MLKLKEIWEESSSERKKRNDFSEPPLSSSGRGEWWVPRSQLPPAPEAGLTAAPGRGLVVAPEASGGSAIRGGRGGESPLCAGGEGAPLGTPSAAVCTCGLGCLGLPVTATARLPEASSEGDRERQGNRDCFEVDGCAHGSRLAPLGRGTLRLS